LLYGYAGGAYCVGCSGDPQALIIGPGNPLLKAERSMEYEGGVDLGAWDNRLNVGLTGSWKKTQHLLIDQQLGFDGGNWTYEENVGTVRNTGVEASVNALVIESRAVTWSVTASAA